MHTIPIIHSLHAFAMHTISFGHSSHTFAMHTIDVCSTFMCCCILLPDSSTLTIKEGVSNGVANNILGCKTWLVTEGYLLLCNWPGSGCISSQHSVFKHNCFMQFVCFLMHAVISVLAILWHTAGIRSSTEGSRRAHE